jgi:hypothetical protein
MVELRLRGRIRSLGRERADVHLVKDVPIPGKSVPSIVGPREGKGVHDEAAPMHAIRLIAGSGIGKRQVTDAERVPRPGPRVGYDDLVKPVLSALERRRVFVAARIVHEIDAFRARRVKPKTHPSVLDLRAERHRVAKTSGNRMHRSRTYPAVTRSNAERRRAMRLCDAPRDET